MSWLDWVKTRFAGKPVLEHGGEGDAGERAHRREVERAARRDGPSTPLSGTLATLPDGPKKVAAYFERGVAHKRLGDLDSALRDFERVAKAVPGLADVHAHRGECLLWRHDYEPAIDSLDRAIALLPVSTGLAVTYLNRGRARAAIGELEGALDDFARAAELAPEAAEAAREEQARLGHEREPGSAGPSQRASGQQRRGDAGDAIAQGWERDAQGDVVGALVAFGKAIAIAPSTSAYYGRGVANCKLRRYREAIVDLDRALELRPRFAAALTERGLAYVESGEVDHGLADYDAAIAADPSYALAYENKAAALLLEGRWAAAVPCLDIALRITPRKAALRYHRGVAHEQLGDLARAVRDLRDSVRYAPAAPYVPDAEQRLRSLRKRAPDVSEPELPAPESLWPVLTGITLEDTVAALVRRVHAEGAFFGKIDLPDGSSTFAQFHGQYGIYRRLTEVADAIGPRILELKLGQLPGLLSEPASRAGNGEAGDRSSTPSPAGDAAETLVEGVRIHVLKHGERLLGVFSEGIPHHDLALPTVLLGERPIFGRSDRAPDARRCSSCGRDLAYFDAVLERDKLVGYACPRCGASPTLAWVEERMRRGRWSRCGFLGDGEVLQDVIARDERTLERLGLSHAQIAGALDHLLAGALAASADRIAQADRQFADRLIASGQRGVPGLAVLPLGATLDELEQRLRSGDQLPAERGTTIDGHDVFLQVHGGYQYCPFTNLQLPWSDEEPARMVIRRRVAGIAYLSEPTDRQLPCRPGLSYRYANLDFLVVRRDTRQALRGAGLIVHLIRDHRCFEGEGSPFRLDPEQAAQVLGLT